MVFKKQSDFLDELPINSLAESEDGPRRSFKLEDLQNLDPHCRETVSIDLGEGGFEPVAATFESLEPAIAGDIRAQTLIQTGEFGNPQTLIKENLRMRKRAGILSILTLGILGGIFIAGSVMYQQSKNAPAEAVAVAPVSDFALPVEPAAEVIEPDMFTVPQNEVQQNITVQESIVVPESGIVEYANTQPVQIAPRQFLYATGTQRTFGSSLTTPKYKAPKQEEAVTTARSLRKSGADGSYQHRKDGSKWQGDWKLDSPNSNISKAENFSGYAQNQGVKSLDSLSVVQQPKSGLLKSAQGTSLTPKLSK